MAKVKTTPTSKKKCQICLSEKKTDDFYATPSPMYADGRVNICKVCTNERVSSGKIEQDVIPILQMFDRPFIMDLWEDVVEKNKEKPNLIFSKYMHFVNTTYRNDFFSDSKSYNAGKVFITLDDLTEYNREMRKKIKIDNETLDRWGSEFTTEEYIQLESFYSEMAIANEITSPQQKYMLKQICKIAVYMDKSMREENFATYEKLAKQYHSMLESTGWKPSSSVRRDEAVGIRTFSQIFEEVERDGHIKPVPISEHRDTVDVTLKAYINHVRKLLDLSKISNLPEDVREEVDDFYDEE